jgi:hypothetical protein
MGFKIHPEMVKQRATFFSEYSLVSVSSEYFYLLLFGSKKGITRVLADTCHCKKNLITFFRLVLFFQAPRADAHHCGASHFPFCHNFAMLICDVM